MAKEFTSDIVWRKDLAYVAHGGPSQILDLYAPKRAKDAPLIVWIHGGAFLFGSKEIKIQSHSPRVLCWSTTTAASKIAPRTRYW
jgi:acetyl esterase/lipase